MQDIAISRNTVSKYNHIELDLASDNTWQDTRTILFHQFQSSVFLKTQLAVLAVAMAMATGTCDL